MLHFVDFVIFVTKFDVTIFNRTSPWTPKIDFGDAHVADCSMLRQTSIVIVAIIGEWTFILVGSTLLGIHA